MSKHACSLNGLEFFLLLFGLSKNAGAVSFYKTISAGLRAHPIITIIIIVITTKSPLFHGPLLDMHFFPRFFCVHS